MPLRSAAVPEQLGGLRPDPRWSDGLAGHDGLLEQVRAAERAGDWSGAQAAAARLANHFAAESTDHLYAVMASELSGYFAARRGRRDTPDASPTRCQHYGGEGMTTPPHPGHSQFVPQPGMPHQQPGCRFCGAVPAAETTFRSHQGFLVMMRSQSLRGPYCRICGIAIFREMTTSSLWQGWWGPLSLVLANPITIALNLVSRARIKKLGPPVPGHPRPQVPLGRPVTRRPAAFVAVIPLIWALWVISNIIRDVT
ncbi:hypothetical protein ABZW18_00640 [Streptomyces sp. NPDC004647]|uniref:hypothetical protein n=1 Tax=Streptomyces sp. NPDC004647 TaxID=3154671 RepID=UPI0033B8425B